MITQSMLTGLTPAILEAAALPGTLTIQLTSPEAFKDVQFISYVYEGQMFDGRAMEVGDSVAIISASFDVDMLGNYIRQRVKRGRDDYEDNARQGKLKGVLRDR